MQQNGNQNQNQFYPSRNVQNQIPDIVRQQIQHAQAQHQFQQMQQAQLLAQQHQFIQQQQMGMYPFPGGMMGQPVYIMGPENQIHLLNMQSLARNPFGGNPQLGQVSGNPGFVEPSSVATNVHPSMYTQFNHSPNNLRPQSQEQHQFMKEQQRLLRQQQEQLLLQQA